MPGLEQVRKIAKRVEPSELNSPTILTVLKMVWQTTRTFAREPTGQIVGTTFLLLMLWGYHGQIELLRYVWPDWRGPGVDLHTRPQLIPGVPWDNELISFLVGALLLVGVPVAVIRWGFRKRLRDFGLGLPPKGHRRVALITFVALVVISLPGFYLGTKSSSMREVYPLYRPLTPVSMFLSFEAVYFLFFLSIEFIFRGFLLFGLAQIRDVVSRSISEQAGAGGVPGPFVFGKYAILVQMLSYTAWHLGKPVPELWGTLVWGLAAGTLAFASRSIWPVVVAHWLLNVFFDAIITFGNVPSRH